jgi:hypothetical protein
MAKSVALSTPPLPDWMSHTIQRARAHSSRVVDSRLLSPTWHRDKLLEESTKDRIRYWVSGSLAAHEMQGCRLDPTPPNNSISLVGRFLPWSQGTRGGVHEGAIASLMDSVLGSCAFANGSGGPTLSLELKYEKSIPYSTNGHPSSLSVADALFRAQIDEVRCTP